MPFKPVVQTKCPKCGKSVYAAEERAVGELKFHKECYKCSMCNKMLDSTNMNCHESVLFCKTCHGRKYGPKGYGFGGGAAGLSMDTGAHLDYGRDDKIKDYKAPRAAPGEGCPRCGGKVYAAEEMLAKGKSYHRTCFNCKSCRKPLDSTLHCDGPDKEVYCRVCYGGKFGPKGYGYGHGAGTLQSRDPEVNPMVRAHGNADFINQAKEGEEACPRCGGVVYNAEMMLAKGRPFHRKCFKCRNCKRPLDSMTHCDGPDDDIYCRLCYSKKYGPKGYGFAAGSGGVLTAENIPGGEDPGVNPASVALDVSAIQAVPGEGCPRCGGKVFMAEEMFARGKSWHKRCFNCCHCKRPLDSVVGCDSADGEVYCKLCYAKKYGPKGYGFASGGGGVLSADNIGSEDLRGIDKASAIKCQDVSKIQALEGEGCPRCGGKVYMAEEIHARARSWHKKCYTCCHCHRPLDSVVGCDAPDGEVYCKLCYAKKYGPKGYGFASGGGGVLTAENIPGGGSKDSDMKTAAAAIDTSSIQAVAGEGCPRCGGKVFSAEEMLSRKNKWHKRCFNCLECRRPLDSMILCDAPDGEIYCKLCYAKRFGPKGYGFASGAGGVLVPEHLSVDEDTLTYSTTPSTYTSPSIKNIAPAKEGQARCPRCGGAVFQAESMVSRNKEWHKQCFNCCECHRPLDSMIGCDAPDGEIYCKLCYAKRHGPKGYGYGHSPCLVSLGTEDGTPVPSDIRQFGFGTGKARQFLESQVQHPMNGEDGNRTSQMRSVIVNQIKSLPVAGRVPRGVDQDNVGKKMPWVTEAEHTSQHTRGFSGFPASTMKVKTFQDQDQVTTIQEGGSRSITKKTVIREVHESSSSSVVQSSSSSTFHVKRGEKSTSMSNAVTESNDEAEEIDDETAEDQIEVEENEVEDTGRQQVYVDEEAPRPSFQRLSTTESEEEEVVPTSEFTTQTSSPPEPNNEIFLPNDPANMTTEMLAQMQTVQQQMQHQMQQNFQAEMQMSQTQVQEQTQFSETSEVHMTVGQQQHMEQSSQEVQNEKSNEEDSLIASQESLTEPLSESEFHEAVVDETEVSGELDAPQSETNLEPLTTEVEEEEEEEQEEEEE